jgi:hypothetical protein
MHFDFYTKAVLTVIAGALVVLAAQNASGPSRAQSDPVQKVQICNGDGVTCAPVFTQTGLGIGIPVFAAQAGPWNVTAFPPRN